MVRSQEHCRVESVTAHLPGAARTLSRRDLLRLFAAGAAESIVSELRPITRVMAASQVPVLPDARQAEPVAWSAYARWLHASWTTNAYPERYDCDLPIWYMVMWAKVNGERLDWSWPGYFRKPVVLKFTGEASRDLPLQSWRFATYEQFARLAQAYFGIQHLPVLVARTGGRQLDGSALEISRAASLDRLWPGDIISSGGHAMTFIEPYRGPGHYLVDYRRPRLLQQAVQRLEANAARIPPEERAEYETQASTMKQRIVRHLRDVIAMEERMGYHTPGNPWDPAIEEALDHWEVPGFVPGRMVDSPGLDAPKGDWSRLFSGIVYPDLAEHPLPHVASASGRQMWEWFRPMAAGEECDWRCSTIVLRPFGEM